MDLKQKTFQLVTLDRAVTGYPFKRLNLAGLLRLAMLATDVAKYAARPDVRFFGV